MASDISRCCHPDVMAARWAHDQAQVCLDTRRVSIPSIITLTDHSQKRFLNPAQNLSVYKFKKLTLM